MAAASLLLNSVGRGPNALCTVAVCSVTITATATVYATASGGLPFDLTTTLQALSPSAMQGGTAPNYTQTVNPADIVAVIPVNMSTNGFIPSSFALGTPTYTAIPWQSDNGPAATPGALLTCPCTIRLWGTGAGNALHLAEIADGAVTDAVTVLLYINRNGANN